MPTVTLRSNISPVRPSNRSDWPDGSRPANSSMSYTSFSTAPSNTGVPIGTPAFRFLGEIDDLLAVAAVDVVEVMLAIDHLQPRLDRLGHRARLGVGVGLAPVFQPLRDLLTQAARGPAQMRLEDLADVHPARHAERVEHQVDRRPVGEERHVLRRQDAADDALVAMAAGHLVARLQLALHRHEHLDHLEHAGRQLVAPLQLLAPIDELVLDQLGGIVILLLHRFQVRLHRVVGDRELPPFRDDRRRRACPDRSTHPFSGRPWAPR